MASPNEQTVASSRFTSQARASRIHYGVVAFTLVLTAISYLDRICISTAAPRIEHDLGLTKAQMGIIFSAFTFAYALFEIPSGWLADRFGARLMLTRIVVWWSVLTAVSGMATGFISLVIIRLLFGMGEAGTFPGISRCYSQWLPVRVHGRSFGIAIMTGALGGAITQPLVVYMLQHFSWRECFAVFGAVGTLWAVAWYYWFRDDPHCHPKVNAAELEWIGTSGPREKHGSIDWKRLLRSRNLWALCVMYFGVIYGWYFYLTWLPTYLKEARGVQLKAMGWLSSLPLLGLALGVFLGGWISDQWARKLGPRMGRRLPGLIGLPLAALAIVYGISTNSAITATLFFSAAAGLAAFGVAPAWSVTLQIGGRHTATVSGTMNMFGNLGGALSPVLIGYCVQTGHSWHFPLITLAIGYLLAAACWLFIDPEQPVAD